jgi:hypothetical protein
VTLVDAFVRLQPFGDDDRLNQEIDDAAAVVLATMRSLSRRLRFDDRSLIEDAAQIVLCRLVATGPRIDEVGAPLRDAPNTDAAVRAFLYVSLRRACLSLLPSVPEDGVDLEHLESQPGDLVDFEPAVAKYAAAEVRVRRVYFDELNPVLAEAAAELREIAGGTLTVERVIDAEAAVAQTERKKVKDRRYKRYERALSELHTLVEKDRSLDAEEKKLYHRVVDDLRVRERVGRKT